MDLKDRNTRRMNNKKDFLFVDPKTSNFTIECRILIIKFKNQRYETAESDFYSYVK